MEAAFIYADLPEEANTSYFRVMIPAMAMQKRGYDVGVKNFLESEWDRVPKSVLLERVATPDTEMVAKLRAKGCERLVISFDDLYAKIPETGRTAIPGINPPHEYWRRNHAGFLRMIGQADLVIVPSQRLAEYYAPNCKAIRVVPNYHDPDLWLFSPPDRDPSRVVIGWGGTFGHVVTWRSPLVREALRYVLNANPNVVFRMSHLGETVESMRRQGIRVETFDYMRFSEWPKTVAAFDIGLAPLSGDYDLARSNTKVIEYCLAGVPWVATKGGPYDQDKGGILVSNSIEMREALQHLIDHPEERERLGREGQAHAQQYLITSNPEVYPELLGLTPR